jgi:hypothetical protein
VDEPRGESVLLGALRVLWDCPAAQKGGKRIEITVPKSPR